MLTLTATDAKTRFGQVLQSALVEPVAIEKNGREMAYVVSSTEYHRLNDAIQLNRTDFDAFLAAIDAPSKPNAALRRANQRHTKMLKTAA
jgi:prevent-host-death family protein